MTDRLLKEDYRVRPVDLATAASIIKRYHYAQGGPNTGVQFDGLFAVGRDECLGAAWWLPPTKIAAQSVCAEWRRVLSLCRMAIAPEVPKNAATFLLSKAVRRLRRDGRWDVLLTYADERVGHEGHVYRAAGWEYLGRTKGDYAWLDSAGRQVSKKATKSRTTAEMLALGYSRSGPWPKHKYILRLK